MSAARIAVTFALISILLAPGCGGGGSGSSPAPPSSPPSFAISVNPTAISIAPGTSATANVSLTPENGFSGSATVTLSGFPSGITVSPASPFSLTAAGQTIQLTAAAGTGNGTYNLSLQASSGTLSASASASLAIAPPATFSLAPSSNSVSVQYGTSATSTINFNPGAGATNYTLQLAATGMPGGITASFSPNPAPPTSAATLTLTAPGTGPAESSVPVTLTAIRSTDAAQQTAKLMVSVLAPATTPISSRTDFVRTDDTPSTVAFDSTHNQIFVCNPHLSRIDVVSASTHQIVKSIPVPGGEGLTLSPDNSRVYVGGPMQKLVAIDTPSLQVVGQYTYPKYNGNYIDPVPIAVANGLVLLLGYGSTGFGLFDPATGAITPGNNAAQCMLGQSFARSGDGNKVLVAADSYPGAISLIDVPSASCVAKFQYENPAFAPAANADGSQFAVVGDAIYILSANLSVLGTVSVNGEGPLSGMVFSPDGRLLYRVSQVAHDYTIDEPTISTFDMQTFKKLGVAPSFGGLRAGSGAILEIPAAADPTGLLFGAGDNGLVIDDSTYYQTSAASVQYPTTFGATPAEGSPAASTSVSFASVPLSGTPIVWFGSQLATGVQYNTGSSVLQATAPPANTLGPVNVRIFGPNGAAGLVADGFSYGPYPLTYGDIAGGPQGGASADLFGFGFSADVQGAAINVEMGGHATSVAKTQWSYNDTPYELSLQHLQVTLPPGAPGAQDVTISTPTGTSTVSKGFHVLESVEDYSTTDTLIDVLYDSSRQRLYLSAGNHIDVFSLTTNSFLPSIIPPSVGGSLQLGGLALTPDGSELLAANLTDRSVAIINPDSPSAATAVLMAPNDPFGPPVPYQIATTSQNTAFVSDTLGYVYSLNLANHQVSLDSDPNLFYSFGGDGTGNSISSSRDGSAVCLVTPNSSGGPIIVWTAANNTWSEHNLGNFKLDGSVSGDGNVFSSVGDGIPAFPLDVSFVDSQANVLGIAGLPAFLFETSGGSLSDYVYGHRLNDSGSLIYIPFPQGIDIFDVQHGNLRERITLTETMSNGVSSVQLATRPVHSLAIDATGQHLYMITNKGLTVAELDAVPLSIGSVTPATGPAGTQVKVRGSGFLPGMTASTNGVAAAVSYVDADTLQLTIPSLPVGAVQITLKNPDGQTYVLDDAYTAE